MFQVHFPIPSVLSTTNTEGQLDCSERRVLDTVTEWNLSIHCYYNFECCTRDGTVPQNLLGYFRVDTPPLRALLLRNWVHWNSPEKPSFPTVDREDPTLGRRCTRLDRIHSSDLGFHIKNGFH